MTSLTPVMRIGAQIEEAILAHEPATAKEALDRRRNSVAQLASRIAVMRAGQFVESGPAERILREPGSPYTRELLAAAPEIPRPAKL